MKLCAAEPKCSAVEHIPAAEGTAIVGNDCDCYLHTSGNPAKDFALDCGGPSSTGMCYVRIVEPSEIKLKPAAAVDKAAMDKAVADRKYVFTKNNYMRVGF